MSTTPSQNKRNVVLSVTVTDAPLKGSMVRPPFVEKKLIILDHTELETLLASLLESYQSVQIDADNPNGVNRE